MFAYTMSMVYATKYLKIEENSFLPFWTLSFIRQRLLSLKCKHALTSLLYILDINISTLHFIFILILHILISYTTYCYYLVIINVIILIHIFKDYANKHYSFHFIYRIKWIVQVQVYLYYFILFNSHA